MASILIYGGTKEAREQTALKLFAEKGVGEKANLIRLGEGKKQIGIKMVRELLPLLYVRPAGVKRRGVLILEAQRLTVEAQNTLLKTLEEPPSYIIFILTVPHPRLLLPTVVSRCLTTEAQKEKETKKGADDTELKTIEKILDARSGKRLALFEDNYGYSRESALAFLDTVEIYLHQDLDKKSAHQLRHLWQAKKLLHDESTNVKLIVDELLLSW